MNHVIGEIASTSHESRALGHYRIFTVTCSCGWTDDRSFSAVEAHDRADHHQRLVVPA